MREGGVLIYLVSRHPAYMKDPHILIDARVDRHSVAHSLTKVLWRTFLELLVGEEMCLPFLRPVTDRRT